MKDQQSSGTCWSFAVTSFLESEALRLGHDFVALSPMLYVHPAYLGKAQRYLETQGESYFEAGDLSFSVLDGYRSLGAVPESVYSGMPEGDWQHDHAEMDNLLQAMMASIATSGYGRIKPKAWRRSISQVLTSYLTPLPTHFEFRGERFTPRTFADRFVGINPSEYVEITSYTQCEFSTQCQLDIPANWNGNAYLNVPIDTFHTIVDSALASGYSLAWDGDASESGFDLQAGLAELPLSLERGSIDQAQRQAAFDNGDTTDDHNMHLVGIANDSDGRTYYKMKNSEGDNEQGGYMFMSENYLRLKTISVLVHRDVLSAKLRAALPGG